MLLQIGSFELEGLSYLRIGRYECYIGPASVMKDGSKAKGYWFFRDDSARSKTLRAQLLGHEIIFGMDKKPKPVAS